VAQSPIHLFAPSPAYRFGGAEGRGAVGKNPPYGARFDYLLKEAPKEGEDVKLEVLDAKGDLVRAFSSREEKKGSKKDGTPGPEGEEERGGDGPKPIPAKAGLNRWVWDLRYPPAARFEGLILWGGELDGPRAVPGRYQVRLTAGGRTLTQPFDLRKDPRLATTDADFAQQFDLLSQIRDKLTATHDGIARLRAVREQAKVAADRAKGTAAEKAVAEASEALAKKLTEVEEALYQTKNRSSQDPLNFPIRLNNKLAALGSTVASADAAPTDQARAVWRDLAARIDAELARLDRVLAEDVPAMNRLVREQEIPAIRPPSP
jgi:hypothetical protein